jgi:hypothetical protein
VKSIVAVLAVILGSPFFVACIATPGDPSMGDGADMSEPSPSSSDTATSCANSGEGCPCDEPGQVIECKGPTVRDGNYVTCPAGKRTCSSDGAWGPCVAPKSYVGAVPSGTPVAPFKTHSH